MTGGLLVAAVVLLVVLGMPGVDHPMPDYSGWHTLLETLAIAMSLVVSVTALIRTGDNPRVRLVAVGFLAVALLDLLHTITYPGMSGYFGARGLEPSLAFWLGARLAVSLTLAVMLLPRHWYGPLTWLFLPYTALAVGLGTWMPAWAPTLYVPGQGLSPFKIGMELVILASYAILGLRVLQVRPVVRSDLVACGLFVLTAGEVFFAMYTVPSALDSTLGHVYKMIGTGYFALAILHTQVVEPYNQLRSEKRSHEDTARRLAALIVGAPDGVIVVGDDGRILAHNDAARILFGAQPDELATLTVEDLIPVEQRQEHLLRRAGYASDRKVRAMSPVTHLQALRRDGGRFFADIALSPTTWNGAPCTVAFIRDATDRVKQMIRLEWLATNDELTGLPNRHALEAELAARIQAGAQGGVLMVDLNKVARINSALGRETGDRLLVAAADRLRGNMRHGEYVARFGGDAFVFVSNDSQSGLARAREIVAMLSAPFELTDELHLQITATGGYCRFSGPADSSLEIMQHCEAAVSMAKQQGHVDVLEFDPTHHQRSKRWIELAGRMPEALANAEFRMVYQPRVRLDGDRLAGFEALLRWRAPEGDIPPAEFIPVAEETGFILELGRWALNEVVRQTAEWERAHDLGSVTMAINLSVRQLADVPLPDFLRECLTTHGLPPSSLELEITETAAMENLDWALPRLAQLEAVGSTLALDDFGTGYSSLAYLQSLPFTTIKIDVAFVRRIGTPSGEALLRAILAMTQTLDKLSVAEGVETEQQCEWLRANGCTEGQGYLFARPLEAYDARAYLQRLHKAVPA
ncbi:bifunctional diguanylate cyclase/phosphodiesterase [Lysobacter olei]